MAELRQVGEVLVDRRDLEPRLLREGGDLALLEAVLHRDDRLRRVQRGMGCVRCGCEWGRQGATGVNGWQWRWEGRARACAVYALSSSGSSFSRPTKSLSLSRHETASAAASPIPPGAQSEWGSATWPFAFTRSTPTLSCIEMSSCT